GCRPQSIGPSPCSDRRLKMEKSSGAAQQDCSLSDRRSRCATAPEEHSASNARQSCSDASAGTLPDSAKFASRDPRRLNRTGRYSEGARPLITATTLSRRDREPKRSLLSLEND